MTKLFTCSKMKKVDSRSTEDRMKRLISLLLLITAFMCVLSGCIRPQLTISPENEYSGEKVRIVTTMFPQYDWVRELMGEKAYLADITMIPDNGIDLHSFDPNEEERKAISECDIFIYNGGKSDAWVQEALKDSSRTDRVVIDLMSLLRSQSEPISDEHIWLSMRYAKTLCKGIAEALCQKMPDHRELFSNNLKIYCEKLTELDSAYQDAVSEANRDTLFFGDKFPFYYLMKDYGIKYVAVADECPAETDNDFEKILYVSKKMDEVGADVILTMEYSGKKTAETVRINTAAKNQKIMSLHSMQSVTGREAWDMKYLTVMQDNLSTIKTALS